MNASFLVTQSQRLLQIGIILLFYSAFEGFVIPLLASPRIGLSVHTLSGFEGVFLLAVGLLWPRLKLGASAARVTFWCTLYGPLAILAAYSIAAIWGVGIQTIALMGELPHGLAHGTPMQETTIRALAYSSAPPSLISFALILWGLRGGPAAGATKAG